MFRRGYSAQNLKVARSPFPSLEIGRLTFLCALGRCSARSRIPSTARRRLSRVLVAQLSRVPFCHHQRQETTRWVASVSLRRKTPVRTMRQRMATVQGLSTTIASSRSRNRCSQRAGPTYALQHQSHLPSHPSGRRRTPSIRPTQVSPLPQNQETMG